MKNHKAIPSPSNEKDKPPRKKSDELLKGAFQDNFLDFLRFVYPDAQKVLDFDKGIEFLDKELFSIIPDREHKRDKRVADLLARVYLKNGTEKWILLLKNKNPFALIALACQKALLEGKIPEEELNNQRLEIVKALLKQNYDPDRVRSFILFIKNFIFIKDQDINRKRRSPHENNKKTIKTTNILISN
jgi:hypothetical protein